MAVSPVLLHRLLQFLGCLSRVRLLVLPLKQHLQVLRLQRGPPRVCLSNKPR